MSSHTTCQAWHIGEPLRGITSCWCDVFPPEPCFNSHGCCLPPRGIFYFLSFGCTPSLSCWLLSPHVELLWSPRQHISLTLIPCWVLASLPDYSASTYTASHGVSNMWLIAFGLLLLPVCCLHSLGKLHIYSVNSEIRGNTFQKEKWGL